MLLIPWSVGFWWTSRPKGKWSIRDFLVTAALPALMHGVLSTALFVLLRINHCSQRFSFAVHAEA